MKRSNILSRKGDYISIGNTYIETTVRVIEDADITIIKGNPNENIIPGKQYDNIPLHIIKEVKENKHLDIFPETNKKPIKNNKKSLFQGNKKNRYNQKEFNLNENKNVSIDVDNNPYNNLNINISIKRY